MSLVHVYPKSTGQAHHVTIGGGAGCWCEPEIKEFGVDSIGQPARVFVHRDVEKP